MATTSLSERLPKCVKCERSMLEIDAFLVLCCEHVICNLCANLNKHQAFCPVHEQQCIGEFLDSAVARLRSMKAVLLRASEFDPSSQAQSLCDFILRDIAGGRDRMRIFRMKSESFRSSIASEEVKLERIREKFRPDYDFRPKSHTDAVDWQQSSASDCFVVCKVCYRLNPDNLKSCPGCGERGYQVVWKCHMCNTINPNGKVHCSSCGAKDRFQAETFGCK